MTPQPEQPSSPRSFAFMTITSVREGQVRERSRSQMESFIRIMRGVESDSAKIIKKVESRIEATNSEAAPERPTADSVSHLTKTSDDE